MWNRVAARQVEPRSGEDMEPRSGEEYEPRGGSQKRASEASFPVLEVDANPRIKDIIVPRNF